MILKELEAKYAELGAEIERLKAKPTGPVIPEMVKIKDRSYSMGKYPITQRQWESLMGNNPSEDKDYDKPVTNVSWHDAQEYIKKLNETTGRKFRLPTEDEWQHCCGPDPDPEKLDEHAWYSGNCDSLQIVGQKKPNANGLYDMLGNIWEWQENGY